MSKSLYVISEELNNAIESSIDQETGEVTDMKLIDGLNMDVEEKVKNITWVIKQREHSLEAIKIEKARLKALEESTKKQMENLKQYLITGMQLAGRETIDLGTFKVSVRNNAPSLVLSDELELDMYYVTAEREREFKKAKAELASAKKEIKEQLKAGIEVIGASLVSKKGLSIK